MKKLKIIYKSIHNILFNSKYFSFFQKTKGNLVVIKISNTGRFMPSILEGVAVNSTIFVDFLNSYFVPFKYLQNKSYRIKFYSNKFNKFSQSLLICDESFSSNANWKKILTLNFDYFSDKQLNSVKLPYFIHPDFQSKPRYSKLKSSYYRNKKRNIRILFAGDFPSNKRSGYKFNTIDRFEILTFIVKRFSKLIFYITSYKLFINIINYDVKNIDIVFSVPTKSNKNKKQLKKHLLNQSEYLELLSQSSFFIAPPGVVMPYSHNFIESISVGTIPIFNYNSFLDPKLVDGVNCLTFNDEKELFKKINIALNMEFKQISMMKEAVLNYYENHLSPNTINSLIFKIYSMSPSHFDLIVNAEHKSVELYFDKANE